MSSFHVRPSTLRGEIKASASKSHTLRAILFATLAKGKSRICNYLHSPDTEAMINACRYLGANIQQTHEEILVTGTDLSLKTPDNIIDCGNSGQVLRFVAAIASLLEHYVIFTGDHSIRHNRPVQPLIDGLSKLNVFCASTKNDGHAPLIVKGPLKAGHTTLLGHDSQPVSALLIACAFAKGESTIEVIEPGEKPWIDLTLDWFNRFGIRYENKNYEHYRIQGGNKLTAFDYQVPGDFSSLAFPITAAIVTQSEICIRNVDINDKQGDKKLIFILQQMGANITLDNDNKTLTVHPSKPLQGTQINANDLIDAVPILAVIGCFALGKTEISDAGIAREKECDRLHAITLELKKMGANISETPKGLIIEHSKLHGASLESHHDHRIVMALVVASLAAQGESKITGVEWVKKSYPDFYQDFKQLNADINIL